MNKKGAILIVSLWVLLILSMLAIAVAGKLSLEIKVLHNQLDSLKAFWTAKAGICRAVNEKSKSLNEDTEAPNPLYADYPGQPWMNNELLFKEAQFGEGVYNIVNIDNPSLYGISDEQAKLNINKAGKDALSRLLEQRGVIAQEANSLSDAIINWRKNNSDFEAIEEILLVDGFSPEIFYGKDANSDSIIDKEEEGIKRFITVYGSGKVNINTADRAVLEAVLGSVDLAGYIVDFRDSDPTKPGQRRFVAAKGLNNESDSIRYILNGIPPDDFNVPGLDSTGRSALWSKLKTLYAGQSLSIDVRSSVFRINSAAVVNGLKRNIEAVVEFKQNQNSKAMEYNFLYWRQK